MMTAAACLRFIEQRGRTALDCNLITIAGGVLYTYLVAVFVAEKAERKSKAEVKASLAKVFGESDNPNSNVSRSKRYEFAKLCVDISSHREMRTLVIKAATRGSIEAAAADLATEFSQRARSVADLARYFGTERTSGRNGVKEPVARPFLILLRALVEKAEKDQQRIPFAESVKVLAPAATQQDVTELIKHLIPHTADHMIPELVDILNRVVERRRANA